MNKREGMQVQVRKNDERVWKMERIGIGALLLSAAVLMGPFLPQPAFAQVVPEGMVPGGPVISPIGAAGAAVLPSGAVGQADNLPTGIVADPLRVYGDDAPTFSGLDFLGALGVKVVANGSVEYNDNLPRLTTRPIGPNSRYSSRDDWIFRPSVSVSAGRAIGRQQLFVVGNVGRDIYARNTLLNRNRIGVNGGVNWALGVRCNGRLQGGYSKRGTQFGTFEDVIPSTQESWNLDAGGSCRSAMGTYVSLGYNRRGVTNQTDDPTGRVNRSYANVRGQGANASIGYPLGRRGEIGVSGQWRNQEFPNQMMPWGQLNGSNIWSANAYANYRLGQMLRVDGGVGKSWVKPNNPFSPDFGGVSWNAGLTYSGPRLGATISTGRNVNGSSGGQANYSIGDFRNVTLSYRANERLGFSTGASFSNLTYQGFALLPETELVRKTKNQRYFIGADYRLNRILSFSLDFNHNRRSSSPALYSYKVNSATLGVRASF